MCDCVHDVRKVETKSRLSAPTGKRQILISCTGHISGKLLSVLCVCGGVEFKYFAICSHKSWLQEVGKHVCSDTHTQTEACMLMHT